MPKTCARCSRSQPASEFGISRSDASGRNKVCKSCLRIACAERWKAKIDKRVREMYDGRCVICDTQENLEIVPILKTTRRDPKGMILICSHCKTLGIPEINPHIRDCTRCGHRWIAHKKNTVRCYKCGSPYWNKPRRK